MLYRLLASGYAYQLPMANEKYSFISQFVSLNRVAGPITLSFMHKNKNMSSGTGQFFHLILTIFYTDNSQDLLSEDIPISPTSEYESLNWTVTPDTSKTVKTLWPAITAYCTSGYQVVKDSQMLENNVNLLSDSWDMDNVSTILLPKGEGDYGDYVLGRGKQQFLSNEYAVAQAIYTRLKLLKGEWWEDVSLGLPLFQSVLGKGGAPENLKAVDLLVQDVIRGTPEVTGIKNFSSSLKNRSYNMSCTVNTTYGNTTNVEVIF